MSEDYLPSADEATQFAVMLTAGMPPEEAILYFFEDKENAIAAIDRWMKAKTVRAAITQLQDGKTWQTMNLDERIRFSLDKHYTELSYYLYSRNYVTLQGADKAKADTARTTLEVKQAGLAGKLEPLAVFWDDVKSGKVKLNTPAMIAPKIEAKH